MLARACETSALRPNDVTSLFSVEYVWRKDLKMAAIPSCQRISCAKMAKTIAPTTKKSYKISDSTGKMNDDDALTSADSHAL